MAWRKLNEITLDFDLNPRLDIDQQWVTQLKDVLDNLPPVVVVDTGDGEYLVDGFHRYYAHAESGREELEVERRVGSLEEARDLALILNMTHGRRLTPAEREKAVLEYKTRHPRMSCQGVAANLGMGRRTVERILQVSQQKRTSTAPLSREHELVLARSRLASWQKEDIRKAARRRDWTAAQVRDAVKTIQSPQIPEGYKKDVLSGQAEPITFTKSGEPAFTPGQIDKDLSDAFVRDIQIRLRRALKAMDELAMIKPQELAASAPEQEAFGLLEHLYSLASWISEVRHCLNQKLQQTWQ